ncbi:signal peptidase II [bacterium]|jgi:signal peptidase II|nr:signal peptidase II [bacterium]
MSSSEQHDRARSATGPTPPSKAGSLSGVAVSSGAATTELPALADLSIGRAPLRRHVILLVVVALLVALDLWSKSAVFTWFQDPEAQAALPRSERGHPRFPLIGEWLGFMLNLNYGAAFGKGGSMPWLLVGGRCVAAVFLTFLIYRTPTGQRVYLGALVLILSGALGNLYDNFTFAPAPDLPGVQEGRPFGPVRDFIDVYFYGWDWHFPTFNVADSCITVGAILLLLSGIGGGRSKAPQELAESSAAGPSDGPARGERGDAAG